MSKIGKFSLFLLSIVILFVVCSTALAKEVAIVVNQDLQPFIQPQLNAYMLDLETQGYNTFLITCITDPDDPSVDSPLTIRQDLITRQASGLEGAVLIGNVPAAWFEILDDFELHMYLDFPTDVYYMDLNGSWTDSDGNGKWDWYTVGDMEIWISRIRFPGANEAMLINNYFNKAHHYKTKDVRLPQEALLIIDRDWNDYTNYYQNGMQKLYSSLKVVSGPGYDDVTIDTYKQELTVSREWTRTVTHANYNTHAIDDYFCYYIWPYKCYYYREDVTCQDIESIDPPCFFYDLAACNSCRFTVSSSYLGGSYMSGTYGIGILGATNTGGINFIDKIYSYLGSTQEANLGEALIYHLDHNDDLAKQAGIYWNTSWEAYWHHWFLGMTVLGDGTLKPGLTRGMLPTANAPVAVAQPESVTVSEDASFSLDGSASYDLDGDRLTYQWSMNGAILGEEPTLTYTIDTPGVYTITLTVSDGFNTATDTVQVNVLQASSISGYVKARSRYYRKYDLANVTLKLYCNGQFVTSRKTGIGQASGIYYISNFSFNNLIPGTYQIVPSKSGYQFYPTSYTVTISEPGTAKTGIVFSMRRSS